MGTVIAGAAVAAVLFLAVRSMIRRKKEGGCLTCGNGKECGTCRKCR